jgi:hypothetical protein
MIHTDITEQLHVRNSCGDWLVIQSSTYRS